MVAEEEFGGIPLEVGSLLLGWRWTGPPGKDLRAELSLEKLRVISGCEQQLDWDFSPTTTKS